MPPVIWKSNPLMAELVDHYIKLIKLNKKDHKVKNWKKHITMKYYIDKR